MSPSHLHSFAHNSSYLEWSAALLSAELIPLCPLRLGRSNMNNPRELSQSLSLRLGLVHFLPEHQVHISNAVSSITVYTI